jgi:hypothetical protein
MSRISQTLEEGQGVFRLIPIFVPRRFARAGRRLRLHPDDYYPLGMARGSIKERWFSSVIPAMNGPLAPPDEGLSYVEAGPAEQDRFTLRDAVQELGAALVGPELIEKHGGWPMYSKFFDYRTPLFFHLHLDDLAAGRVGLKGKPESYYFPPQLNNNLGDFPATYFGFDPSVDLEEVRTRVGLYERTDNRITELSRAFRIELGTGWYTPPGVLHAPGSVLTYEPQWNSDVNSVQENVVAGEVYPYEFLTENCPDEKKRDLEYVLSLMDWEKNVDTDYRKHFFRPPVAGRADDTYAERWISYANPYFSAKELTVPPGCRAVVTDSAAYGCIIIQGHGSFAAFEAEAAGMLRYGQRSADEYFVSEAAAASGITIHNRSRWEPMVMLQHFGPNNSDAPTRSPLWDE